MHLLPKEYKRTVTAQKTMGTLLLILHLINWVDNRYIQEDELSSSLVALKFVLNVLEIY